MELACEAAAYRESGFVPRPSPEIGKFTAAPRQRIGPDNFHTESLLPRMTVSRGNFQSLPQHYRIEAQRRKASALRFRHSQSLASLRQRLSQPMVRSTIQRLGRTVNVFAVLDRLTISRFT